MTTQIERTDSPRTALVIFRAVTSLMGSELIRPLFSPSQPCPQPCARHQWRDLIAATHAPIGTGKYRAHGRGSLNSIYYCWILCYGVAIGPGGAASCRPVGFPDREADLPTPDRLGGRGEPAERSPGFCQRHLYRLCGWVVQACLRKRQDVMGPAPSLPVVAPGARFRERPSRQPSPGGVVSVLHRHRSGRLTCPPDDRLSCPSPGARRAALFLRP
jgi:hypothetical protein